MHKDTIALLRFNGIEPIIAEADLYNSPVLNDVLSIKTHYESIYLKEGKKITYLKFTIPNDKELKEIE